MFFRILHRLRIGESIASELNAKMNDNNRPTCYYNGNTTLFGNESFERSRISCSGLQPDNVTAIGVLSDIIFYVVLVLGIPGNVLSAIVWMRRHVAGKNSSAVYLAALAVNDIIYLVRTILRHYLPSESKYFGWLSRGLGESARILEPLLVLSFSAERLFAILRPLQVCCRLRGN